MFELNKNFNLLDEQLAESGLEMTIEPTTGLILGGISAATSIVGGIFGASQADQANRKAEKAAKEAQEAANKAAKLQNKYNKKKFEVDKENYYKNAEYSFETAMQQYYYDTSIQEFKQKQDAKKYLRDAERLDAQYAYNRYAFDSGAQRIQTGLNEQAVADSFERQESLVASLKSQGQLQTMAAGTSSLKARQAGLAASARDIAVMDASRKSAIDAANADLLELGYNKYVADRNTALSAMLRPERMPTLPAPTRPPEPTWLEPMKVLPQTISAPVPQSVTAPIIQGITGAAGTLAGLDWNVKQSTANQYLGLSGNQYKQPLTKVNFPTTPQF